MKSYRKGTGALGKKTARALAIAVATVLVLTTAACAPIRYSVVAPGDVRTVGIVNQVGEKVTNSHVGMTMFGNSFQSLENDWKIPKFLEDNFMARLAEHGVTGRLVVLEAGDADLFSSGRCFSTWDGKFKPECEKPMGEALHRLNLDALMVIKEFGIQDYYSGTNQVISGYGLYTHGPDRPSTALVYAHLSTSIFAGDPVAPRQSGGCFSTQIEKREDWPRDIQDLSIEELAWIRPKLEGLIASRVKATLSSSGIIPGGPVECELLWGKKK